MSVISNLTILFEIPFFVATVILTFLASRKMRGGRFGRGMSFLMYGMIMMITAHVHLIILRMFNISVFHEIFGLVIGTLLLGVFLLTMWTFFILGFLSFIRE
jgi:hypothetical protein